MSTGGLPFSDSQDGKRLLERQLKLLFIAMLFTIAATFLPLDLVHIPLEQYVPIHTVLELCSIVVGCLVFGTVWFMPSRDTSTSQVIISAALLAAAVLDFMHMMSINGMPSMVTPSNSQKSIAFWLAGRAVVAGALMIGSFIPKAKPLSPAARRVIASSFAIYVIGFTIVALFYPGYVPVLFVMNSGTTQTKMVIELLLIGVFAYTAFRYYKFARIGTESYYSLMFGAVAVTAVGELFFAHYAVANDVQNLLGHLYKIVSYWLIFQAMFILSIRKPYELLAEQAEKLKTINESLRLHSLAMESTATPVSMTDVSGRITWQNHAAMSLNCAVPNGGATIFDPGFTPNPEDAAQMRNKLGLGEVWRGRVCLKQNNGENIYLDRTITPVRNETCAVEGYVSVAENITENVLAKARHKRVLETALDGYCVIDSSYWIIESNEAFCNMTGYTARELLTKKLHDLKHASDLSAFENNLRKAKQAGYTRLLTNYLKKDGDPLPVEVAITSDNLLDQFYVFFRDRTAQEHEATAKQDLERQLLHAQKIQALGQLTGGIAHDFNNILASILGYSNLALNRFAQDKETKLNKYLREIVSASERARDLIAKMMTFTRIQPSGPVGIIEPSVVVLEVVDMLRPSIPSSIHLATRTETRHRIRMDGGELNQVLVNLIINARDAISAQGAINVRVMEFRADGQLCAITNQRLTGNFVGIEVSDTGCGIEEENFSSLFNPFFTTKDVGKGTGLGLAMVRGIMQRNGGHVIVNSFLGMGSQFNLLFPIAKSEEEISVASIDSMKSQPGAGQTIWIVDDEKSVAEYLGELLTDSGYQVRIFNDPLIALGAFRANQLKVQLLITDQTMPGFTGLQMVGQMHKIRHDLPVIMCTGYGERINAKELGQHVIEKVFIKPVPAQELLQAVSDVLEKIGNNTER